MATNAKEDIISTETTDTNNIETNAKEDIIPTETSKQSYFKLPGSIMEVESLSDNVDDIHPSLQIVRKSIESNRACNEAIIFSYGCSGSGKSESLNTLFGFPLIHVINKQGSDTRDVSEYVASLVDDRWGVKNLEIGFIDAPGFKDTLGSDQDAMNLATISRFIKEHIHLGSSLYSCYPNVVLIAIQISQNRMEGNEASMLKIIRELKVIDYEHPNVIIVLTHVMSLPLKLFQSELEMRKQSVMKLVYNYLGLSPRIVWLENKPEDYGLKRDEDMVILPDETVQPKNLFREIILMMEENEDPIGQKAISIYLYPKLKAKPERKNKLLNTRTNLEDQDVKEFKSILLNYGKDICDSEIIIELKKYQKLHRIKRSLLPLMEAFNKANIDKVSELKDKSLIEINRLLAKNYTLDGEEKELLMHLFNLRHLEYPCLLEPLCKSYDKYLKECLNNKIFIQNNRKHLSNGVIVPTHVEVSEVNTLSVKCRGKKITTCQNEQTTEYEFTVIKQTIKMEVKLNERLENLFSNDFKASVNKLLEITNDAGKIEDQLIQYTNFLEKFGDLFAIQSLGGGKIEGKFVSKAYTLEESVSPIVEQYIKKYLKSLKNEKEAHLEFEKSFGSLSKYNELFDLVKECKLNFLGGAKPSYCCKLGEMTQQIWNEWKRSLLENLIRIDNHTDMKNTCATYNLLKLKESSSKFDKVHSQLMKLGFYPNNAHRILDSNRRLDISNCEAIRIDDSIQNLYGFPPKAKVMQRTNDGTLQEKEIRELQKGDKILCVSLFNMDITYANVTKITSDTKTYGYFTINYSTNNEIRTLNIGRNNEIAMRGRHLSMGDIYTVKAKNILNGEHILKVDITNINYNISNCPVTSQGNENIENNYIIEYEYSHSYKIMVDGIICGDMTAGKGCFPGNSKVILKGGDQIPISQLQLGQSVLSVDMKTNKLLYTKVYLWAHGQPHTVATFLRIVYQGGAAITLTHNHLLPTNTAANEHCIPPKMLPASQLKVGDIIYTTTATSSNRCATPVRVLSISTCTQTGYYAPLTNNSVIVVDGVVASVFSLPASPSSSLLAEQGKLTKHLSLHTVAHQLFTPLRVASKFGLSNSLNRYIDAETGIHKYCNALLEILKSLR